MRIFHARGQFAPPKFSKPQLKRKKNLMKKQLVITYVLLVLAILSFPVIASLQSRDTPTVFGGYRTRGYTAYGTGAPPSTCSELAGDQFIRTDAPIAAYLCTAANTWTRMTPAKLSAVLSPAEVAANTCAEQTFTVTGVVTTDVVTVNKPTAQAGLGVAGVRASATDQVGINFCNVTASPITPTASQTYVFLANH